MAIQIKRLIKTCFRKVGLDLRQIHSNPDFLLSKALRNFNIDIVFDIGSNKGQFALELRSFGYLGRIVSFEPLSDPYQVLTRIAAQDPLWTIHKRGAIGDFNGDIEINIAGNSASSSVLPMQELHSEIATNSAYIGIEKVPISRLDLLAPTYLSESNSLFIKIDTQGFEWQVLDGAKKTLERAKGVLCEVSFVSLYKDQHLWLDILNRLEAEGFVLWSIQPGFSNSRNGRVLQADVIFFRV